MTEAPASTMIAVSMSSSYKNLNFFQRFSFNLSPFCFFLTVSLVNHFTNSQVNEIIESLIGVEKVFSDRAMNITLPNTAEKKTFVKGAPAQQPG